MAEHYLSRILLRPPWVTTASGVRTLNSAYYEWRNLYSTTTTTDETLTEAENEKNKKGKWLTLPPFTYTLDGAALGKDIFGPCSGQKGESTADGTVTNTTTALKWVTKCCPQLPRSLVQKLFRLRQVCFLNLCIPVRRYLYTVFFQPLNAEHGMPNAEMKPLKHVLDFIWLPMLNNWLFIIFPLLLWYVPLYIKRIGANSNNKVFIKVKLNIQHKTKMLNFNPIQY